MNSDSHDAFMRAALAEAMLAFQEEEVPIGAVIVKDNVIIARAHNRREGDHDATAHAEIIAIRRAGQALGDWRLEGCSLYVTVEPCPMCAGALVQSRVEHLIYGATDPKAWADRSLMEIVQNPGLNHRMDVTGGVLAEECRQAMVTFFRSRRKSRSG